MAEILGLKAGEDIAPTPVLRKVPPGRPENGDVRDREHLTADEVAALVDAVG